MGIEKLNNGYIEYTELNHKDWEGVEGITIKPVYRAIIKCARCGLKNVVIEDSKDKAILKLYFADWICLNERFYCHYCCNEYVYKNNIEPTIFIPELIKREMKLLSGSVRTKRGAITINPRSGLLEGEGANLYFSRARNTESTINYIEKNLILLLRIKSPVGKIICFTKPKTRKSFLKEIFILEGGKLFGAEGWFAYDGKKINIDEIDFRYKIP